MLLLLLWLLLGAAAVVVEGYNNFSPGGVGRRAVVAGPVAGVCVAPVGATAMTARELVQRGMGRFEAADVAGSLEDFDAAVAADPRYRTLLWQRGLSLYYADRFEDAARQFEADVAQNPNDTEESIWYYLSVARLRGSTEAARSFLDVGRDRRPTMGKVYAMFKALPGDYPAARAAVLDVAENGSSGDRFYAQLYLGLLAEARGDAKEAERWIRAAVDNRDYAPSRDYMYSLSKVHAKQRGFLTPRS